MSIYISNNLNKTVNLNSNVTTYLNELNDKTRDTAFSELSTASLHPIIQINGIFDYINPRQIETFISGTGSSITASNGLFNLTNGSDVGGYATLRTLRQLKYRAGQGILFRFTAIFDSVNAVANSVQLGGVGISGNNLCFGYNGTSFGINKKSGGSGEVRRLEITTAEGSSTTAVITLNGVSFNVPLTNAGGSKEFTAYEIGKATYAGWSTSQIGVFVYFNKDATGPASGSYSLNNGGGSSVGTFTQINIGVADTDLWVAQSDWNIDKLDGTGKSGMVLDVSKGNVYQIQYQWLGFGKLNFFIESDTTGNLILVHRINYTNNNTSVSLRKPSLRPLFACASLGSTTPLYMKVGSFAGFNEGIIDYSYLPRWSVSNSKSISSNTETVILVIRNKLLINGIINTSEMLVDHVDVATDGTKSVIIRVYVNCINGAGTTTDFTNFLEVSPNTSTTVYDITSDTKTNGFLVDSFVIQKVGNGFSEHQYFLERNESVTITAESTGASDVICSIQWLEDI